MKPETNRKARAPHRNWLRCRLVHFCRETKGLAAIEFGLIASFLSLSAVNVIDLTTYMYDSMQVGNAAEMGAQAAWVTCGKNNLPATVNCSGLNSAVTTAVQSTSLGSSVSETGSPSEAYYCVNSSGALVSVSAVSTQPSDCSSVGESTYSPGDWVEIQTSYTWSPIIKGLSVVSVLPTHITSSAWMRLG